MNNFIQNRASELFLKPFSKMVAPDFRAEKRVSFKKLLPWYGKFVWDIPGWDAREISVISLAGGLKNMSWSKISSTDVGIDNEVVIGEMKPSIK